MTRRSFFGRLGAALAVAVVPVPAAKPLGLTFHPDACELAMAEIAAAMPLLRLDVLYGYKAIGPAMGCIIRDECLPLQREVNRLHSAIAETMVYPAQDTIT